MLGHTVSISVLISRVAMRRVRTLVCVFSIEKKYLSVVFKGIADA